MSATVPAPPPGDGPAQRRAARRAVGLRPPGRPVELRRWPQPLFALLHKSPEFLAARGALGFDVVSFAIILVVLPPALLLAVELLAGLVDRRRAARCTWPSSPRSRRWSPPARSTDRAASPAAS